MKNPHAACRLLAGAGMAAIVFAGSPANAQQSEIDLLKQQLEVMQKRLEQLEAQQKKQAEAQAVMEKQAVASTAAAPTVTSGNDKVRLELSGQVNRAVLYGDNSDDSETFFVDNGNSSTRFRLVGEADVDPELTVGAQIEVELKSSSSDGVNFDNSNPDFAFRERKLEVYAKSPTYGNAWLGHGPTASDGTSEVDLSGTDLIAYSSIADMAGGLSFSDGNAATADPTVGSIFSNLDGLGRQDRIQYDSPNFAGFVASASTGNDGIWDGALRWGGEFDSFKLNAAIAYSKPANANSQVNGSVSGRFDNGISLTFAAGQRDVDGRDNPEFYYGKAAWEFSAFSFGTTAIGVDYFYGEDNSVSGDEGTSYSLHAVQKIDKAATELYLGVRNHELDRTGVNYDDVFATMGGARVKF